MPLGPGKYDDLATLCREQVKAQGVAVIVIGGDRGHGFAMQVYDADLARRLPDMLRRMADEIEQSL